MDAAAWGAPGFYGKMPCLGDFVSRRAPRAVVEPFNEWLEAGMLASQRVLGPRWLDLFLVSPAWHFALEAGVSSGIGICGVMIPSVDKVGRYFPLTVLCPMPGEASPLTAWAGANINWFSNVEKLLLSTLEEDIDVESFDRRLVALGCPSSDGVSNLSPPLRAGTVIAERYLRRNRDRLGLAWTMGTTDAPAAVIAFADLPADENFTSFLDGRWADRSLATVSLLPASLQDFRFQNLPNVSGETPR